jgi:hypothetical protein
MKKIILLTILGSITFGFVLYFSMAGYLGLLEGGNYPEYMSNDILGTSLVDLTKARTGAAAITPENIDITTNPDLIDESVYSVINLRFDNQTYIIGRGNIESLLGDRTLLTEASTYWQQTGVNRVESLLRKTLDSDTYEKKIYQPNTDGINRATIRGFEYYEQEYSPDVSGTISMIHAIIEARLGDNSGKQEYLEIGKKTHLGTNGEYSEQKYIELDHQKQKIYAWENGELYKVWDASGFYDEYAVFGVFDIKNKSKKAWSPVVNKWMPYWMAFYYCKEQQAWFGIHELVWWTDETGARIEESSDSIGQKKSGGCVRLDRGEMEVLYDWTTTGTPFLIH